MAKQYDNTAKELIEFGPADWVSFIGAPGAAERVSLIDSNLSTITSEADKVIRVNDPEPWLLHLELQASCEPDMARRLLRYTSLLHYRHELPVVSALLLLRKEANSPELTGHYAMSGPFGTNLTFSYLVFKVWEEPPERFLSGGLALLPFAPISRVTESDLPRVVDHLQNRVMQEADTKQRGQIWTATSILLGLRYDVSVGERLLQGVREMEESVTYQAIVRKGYDRGVREGVNQGRSEGLDLGRREGLRLGEVNAILRIGTRRFGPPSPEIRAQIEAIAELDRLNLLLDRVTISDSWAALIAEE